MEKRSLFCDPWMNHLADFIFGILRTVLNSLQEVPPNLLPSVSWNG